MAKADRGLRIFHRPSSARSRPTHLLAACICALALPLAAASRAQATPAYVGAQVHSLWSSVSSAEMNRELDELQSAGANVLRVDVGWATLEWTKGHEDPTYLAKLDALAAGAQARGIKLIATVWQTPPWASAGGHWNDAPANPVDYGSFARFITARYGGELAAVEAWNEPEIHENLLAPNVPAAYAAMLKSFYAGAKEGDPAVKVLAGALAYADLPFLRALYADGIEGHYDAISVHPYADGAAPEDAAVTHSFLGGVQALHAAQQAAGDTTPIWVTEFGWPTGTSAGANSEGQQAEYTERAFALLDAIPYVDGATVYQLRDMGSEASNPEDNFGLLRESFAPTPAYAAFTAAMLTARLLREGEPESGPPFREGAPETGSGTPEFPAPSTGAGSPETGVGTGGPQAPTPTGGSTPPTGGPVAHRPVAHRPRSSALRRHAPRVSGRRAHARAARPGGRHAVRRRRSLTRPLG